MTTSSEKDTDFARLCAPRFRLIVAARVATPSAAAATRTQSWRSCSTATASSAGSSSAAVSLAASASAARPSASRAPSSASAPVHKSPVSRVQSVLGENAGGERPHRHAVEQASRRRRAG